MIPDDPFGEDDVQRIFGDAVADQVGHAIILAQPELDKANAAIEALTARLRELLPAAAIVNFVTSLAVGTAVTGVYGDG